MKMTKIRILRKLNTI